VKQIFMFLALLGPVSSAFATEAAYRCADGTVVRAIFSGSAQAGSVRLMFSGQRRPLILAQAPSADGGRYDDGKTEFWIKGKTARLTRAGAATECNTP
jgi:membrane-bound inhibitor of C-type lysozyme